MIVRSAQLAFCLIFLSVPISADDIDQSDARAEFNTLVDQFEEEGGTSEFAARFFDLADRHRADPVAIEAYVWILQNRRTKEDAIRAIDLIQEHHLADPNIGQAVARIAKVPSPKAEMLLTALIKSNPSEEVRARACLQLARLLEQQVTTLQQLSKNPELKQRVAQYYGKHVVDLPLTAVSEKLERVYEQMQGSFGSVTIDGDPLGKIAKQALFRIRNLSVGRVAPEIEGEDVFGKPFKLSDFRGQVVVLSFWAHW